MNAYLGMVNNTTGKSGLCLTMDNMKNYSVLKLDYDISVGENAGENKGLGVRVDYHTAEGYVSSSWYYFRNYKQELIYSGWGTGTQTATSNCKQFGSDTSGSYNIMLSQYAPSGWDGRIQVTYSIQDAGSQTTANFKLESVS
jgi:hypothetical protein